MRKPEIFSQATEAEDTQKCDIPRSDPGFRALVTFQVNGGSFELLDRFPTPFTPNQPPPVGSSLRPAGIPPATNPLYFSLTNSIRLPKYSRTFSVFRQGYPCAPMTTP